MNKGVVVKDSLSTNMYCARPGTRGFVIYKTYKLLLSMVSLSNPL